MTASPPPGLPRRPRYCPSTWPAAPAPALPEHLACQQILDAFAGQQRPLRIRDLCVALDLPIAAKHVEGIRSKLKKPVSRGVLTEPEPGLFIQPPPVKPLASR